MKRVCSGVIGSSSDRQSLCFVKAAFVQFQAVYDNWHRITPEVEQAANRLIEDLDFTSPKS